MKGRILAMAVLCGLGMGIVEGHGEVDMKITSSQFKPNEMIPKKYTCQGEDVNPPLKMEGLPAQAQSLVLIMEDPDTPVGTWDHWIVYDMPAVGEIAEDSIPGREGTNSWDRTGYGGPCPPSGTHRYFFKLYALDTKLNLKLGARKGEVEGALKGHVLAQAELVGLYKKQ